MAMKKKIEQTGTQSFKQHEHDTGSVEVQIISLTERINNLSQHFKSHAKDFGSKRGLLKMVGQRRRFLNYLAKKDAQKHQALLEFLNLRK